jgi:FkbM family methyltransferase
MGARAQILLNFGEGDARPFVFRDQSPADKGVIQQIFVNRDYDLARLTRFKDIASEYQRVVNAGQTPLIIDCGANIGASPIWFARLFPQAQVFALEPEEHNYEILHLNCQKYSNVTCLRAAISCVEEAVYIEDPGMGDWGFRTTNQPGANKFPVPAYSIESIARRFPDSELLLVKIDIEGAETRLFESNYEWIERAMVIIVELHDWMLPGTANSQNCLKALSRHNRDFVFIGENVFSIRNR